MHSHDTDPAARHLVLEALRRATPAQRLEMAMQQTELLWRLVWAGIVEAFFSQYHAPVLPYAVKIGFGMLEIVLLTLYLALAGGGKKG